MSDRGPAAREPVADRVLAIEPATRDIVSVSAVSLQEHDARSERARRRRRRGNLVHIAVCVALALPPLVTSLLAKAASRWVQIALFLAAFAGPIAYLFWTRWRSRRFWASADRGSPAALDALREGREPNSAETSPESLYFGLLVFSLQRGDLTLLEQVADGRALGRISPQHFAVNLRAIALTLRGFTSEAKALLASVPVSSGWNSLAHAVLARAEGAHFSTPPSIHSLGLDLRSLRMFVDAVSRPPSNAYRSHCSPDGRYAFRRWLERFCPSLVIEPPPFQVSREQHPATWDYASAAEPAPRPRPLTPLTALVATTVIGFGSALALWSTGWFAPGRSSKNLFIGLMLGVMVFAALLSAALESDSKLRLWSLRKRLGVLHSPTESKKGETANMVSTRIAAEAAHAGQLSRAADVAETVFATSFEPDRYGTAVPNGTGIHFAIEHIAWSNRPERAESLLALAEKLFGSPSSSLRFHVRLASALASGDRELAIAIACDLPDEIELDRHIELVAHALQAIVIIPTERERVLRRIEDDPLTHARLRAVAPWVLQELAHPAPSR
jgi:hypothetical protein